MSIAKKKKLIIYIFEYLKNPPKFILVLIVSESIFFLRDSGTYMDVEIVMQMQLRA